MPPILVAVDNLFAAIFIFLVVWAMVSDASRLIIPNWVSVGLVASYFTYALAVQNESPIFLHLIVAGIVFLIGLAFFVRKWVGGGDVKFLAAVALWAGPGLILPLLMIMSVTGIALALIVLFARMHFGEMAADAGPRGAARLVPRWVRLGLCPYGIAIGLASLLTVPGRFF